jgi:hypothetical protein
MDLCSCDAVGLAKSGKKKARKFITPEPWVYKSSGVFNNTLLEAHGKPGRP